MSLTTPPSDPLLASDLEDAEAAPLTHDDGPVERSGREKGARGAVRIAVLGDSVAMAYGGVSTSWPAEVETLIRSGTDAEVSMSTFALHAQTAERSLRRHVPRLVNMDPQVVIVAHGGSEALLSSPDYLIRPDPATDPTRPRLVARWFSERVRDISRRAFQLALDHELPGVDLTLAMARIHPRMSADQFAGIYRDLVEQLLVRTNASVVLVKSCDGLQRDFPFSRTTIEANDRTVDHVAATCGSRDRVTVVAPRDWLVVDRDLLPDGAHLNNGGHARLGRLTASAVLHALAARSAEAWT